MTSCPRRSFLLQLVASLSPLAGLLGAPAASSAQASSVRTRYPALAEVIGRVRIPRASFTRWRHIIGHHSATPEGNLRQMDLYHRNVRHMQNGFAYHFLIGNGRGMRDGALAIGPRWRKQLRGGHVRSTAYNDDSIGICLVGNFESSHHTPKQLATFTQLVTFLSREVLASRPVFLVHREVKGEKTLCPGRHFPAKAMHDRFG